MAKEKQKKVKKGKRGKQPAAALPILPLTGDPTYADGTPLDNINYLEAKLILKPEPFTSVEAFRDFGKMVQKIAKKTGVGYIANPESQRRPQIREITFGDTRTSGCTTMRSFCEAGFVMSMASPSATLRLSSSSGIPMQRRRPSSTCGRKLPASTGSNSKRKRCR